MGFRYLGHTADLRAVVEGQTVGEVYASGVALVRDALAGSSRVGDSESRELHLDSVEPAERFFRFVRELVFLYDSEGFLPAGVECDDCATGPIRVLGEIFDPDRHRSERQIKALTRHDFSFAHAPDGYRAELLFDL